MKKHVYASYVITLLLTCSGCNRGMYVPQAVPSALKTPPVVVEHLAKKLPAPDWTPTLQVAEIAVKTKPNSQRAKFELGLAYYKAERYEEAVTTLEPLAKNNPKSPQMHYWLGCSYIGANHLTQAIPVFEYITNMPHISSDYLTRTYGLIGHCYYDLHADQQAEVALRKALEFDKTNQSAQEILEALHKASTNDKTARQ